MAQRRNPAGDLTLEVGRGLWVEDLRTGQRRQLARDRLGIIDAMFVDDRRFVLAYPEQLLLCELTRLGFSVLHHRRHTGGTLDEELAHGMVRALARASERWPGDYARRKREGLRAAKGGAPVFVAEKPGTGPSPFLEADATAALGLGPYDAAWRGTSGRLYAMARGADGYGLEHVTGGDRRPIALPRKQTPVLADALAMTSIADEPGGASALLLHGSQLFRFWPREHRLEALPSFDYGAFDREPWRVQCLPGGHHVLQSMFTSSIRDAEHRVVWSETTEPERGFATQATLGPLNAAMGTFGDLLVLVRASPKTLYDECDVRIARVGPEGLEVLHETRLPLFAPAVVDVQGELWIVDPLGSGFRLRNAEALAARSVSP